MELLPKDMLEQIPTLYATKRGTDPMVWAKFFTPWNSWTWYVIEFDSQDICLGWVEGLDQELGYFSLAELTKAFRGNPQRLTVVVQFLP